MKVLVPIKRVIDYKVNIRVKADHSGVETNHVKMSINPFDEVALEEALRLKDNGEKVQIIAVTIGEEQAKEQLFTSLAMGADHAIHIVTNKDVEPLNVAKLLKDIVIKENPELVLLGKQAIDDDSNQTGQMLAALLQWPLATFATKLSIKDDHITVERKIDEGLETLKLSKPSIITTNLTMNTPRHASLSNVIKAKKHTIETLKIEDLNHNISPRLKQIKVEEPPRRKTGVKVEDVDDLIHKLKYEAQVI